MRSLRPARQIAQEMADRTDQTHCIWTVGGWRTIVQPEGVEVQGGVILEYVNPKSKEQAA